MEGYNAENEDMGMSAISSLLKRRILVILDEKTRSK